MSRTFTFADFFFLKNLEDDNDKFLSGNNVNVKYCVDSDTIESNTQSHFRMNDLFCDLEISDGEDMGGLIFPDDLDLTEDERRFVYGEPEGLFPDFCVEREDDSSFEEVVAANDTLHDVFSIEQERDVVSDAYFFVDESTYVETALPVSSTHQIVECLYVPSEHENEWSSYEREDAKYASDKPVVVDPMFIVKSRYQENIDEIKIEEDMFNVEDRYSATRFDPGKSYGYLRIRDKIFSFQTPMHVRKIKDSEGVMLDVDTTVYYKNLLAKRKKIAYFVIPHDRLYTKIINMSSKEARILMEIDLDIIDRYEYFTYSRMSRYYVHVHVEGIAPHERMKVFLAPAQYKGNMESFPYILVEGEGKFGAYLDVGFPPIWNDRLKYELVFQGSYEYNVKISGYVKFYITHLVGSVRFNNESYKGKKGSDSTYIFNNTNVFVPRNNYIVSKTFRPTSLNKYKSYRQLRLSRSKRRKMLIDRYNQESTVVSDARFLFKKLHF